MDNALDPERRTVLIIEDSPDIAHLMASVLELSDYKVISASNGFDGLEKLKGVRPDLITVDLKMPVMDGVEFIKKCREQMQCRVPIIIISAADDTEARAGEIGVDQFLAKPFNIVDFVELVDRTLHLAP